jgi:hemolysin III
MCPPSLDRSEMIEQTSFEKKRLNLLPKDPFCGLSHIAGAISSVIGLIALLIIGHGRPWHTIAFAIYGATLILLYTASSLYHSLNVHDKGVELLKRCDHGAIYLLIAGTYTPVCLITLRNTAWGWGMMAAETSMAALGVGATFLLKKVPNVLRVILYLSMGWLAIFAISPLKAALPAAGITWLIAGGLFYTVGTVIYATEKPNLWPGKFTAHDLWHVFVLAGSICHFVMMAVFVGT